MQAYVRIPSHLCAKGPCQDIRLCLYAVRTVYFVGVVMLSRKRSVITPFVFDMLRDLRLAGGTTELSLLYAGTHKMLCYHEIAEIAFLHFPPFSSFVSLFIFSLSLYFCSCAFISCPREPCRKSQKPSNVFVYLVIFPNEDSVRFRFVCRFIKID